MKNILIVLMVICVTFVGCDRRKSKSESLKASVEEFNSKQSNFEIVTYYPKEYTEVVTDTLIANQVKVHIKNYSDAEHNVLISNATNTSPKRMKYHRVFESEVVITSPTKEIFNAHISAEEFHMASTDQFWNNATLQQVWVNQDLSTENNIALDISFINPKENSFKLYRMTIDAEGQKHTTLIEQS